MASKGVPSGSGLKRAGRAERRDEESTDPEATLAGLPDDALDVDDADLEVVPGPEDRTQLQSSPPRVQFKLLVLAGPRAGAEFDVGEDDFTIGRASENRISIPDVSVSRRHVRIVRNPDDTFTVSDLGSGNGTLLNGEKVGEGLLRHGDEFSIGDTSLQLVEVGAPAVKKGRRSKSPQAPSGQEGAPQSPTRQELKKLPAPSGAPAVGLDARKKRLYAAFGLFATFMVMLGVIRQTRTPGTGGVDGEGAEVDVDAFEQARELARQHKWIDAVALIDEAGLAESDDARVQRFAEGARAEAVHEKAVRSAEAALAGFEFAKAGELAASVPDVADVYPQARAVMGRIEGAIDGALANARSALAAGDKPRAKELAGRVLAVRPGDAGAQAVLDEVNKPEKKVSTGARVVAKAPEAEKPVVAVSSSPAVSLYLQGEVGKALRAAEESNDAGAAKLLKQLRAFEANYKDGMAKAQAQRAAEAIRPLGAALSIDREIARGKLSKPGKEVGRQLANMEYLLGLECKGDDQLGRAAAHYRAALNADSTHELSRKALDKAYDRARDLYKEAYIERSGDPDRAKKLFKVVIAALPEDDATALKAKNFLDKLMGAPGGE